MTSRRWAKLPEGRHIRPFEDDARLNMQNTTFPRGTVTHTHTQNKHNLHRKNDDGRWG